MTDYECFRDYTALKAHFSSKTYDYFKYGGKIKSASPAALQKRNDKVFFLKLAKHEDPFRFLLANFLVDPNCWIRDIAYSSEAEKTYKEYIKRNLSLTYLFKSDIVSLSKDIKSEIKCEVGKIPHLLTLYIQKKISLETMVILYDICALAQLWDAGLKDNPLWVDLGFKIAKYHPFIMNNFDKTKMRGILFEHSKSI